MGYQGHSYPLSQPKLTIKGPVWYRREAKLDQSWVVTSASIEVLLVGPCYAPDKIPNPLRNTWALQMKVESYKTFTQNLDRPRASTEPPS